MKAQIKMPENLAIIIFLIVVTFIIIAIIWYIYEAGALPWLAKTIGERKAFKP